MDRIGTALVSLGDEKQGRQAKARCLEAMKMTGREGCAQVSLFFLLAAYMRAGPVDFPSEILIVELKTVDIGTPPCA
jgi:hypothetical protein